MAKPDTGDALVQIAREGGSRALKLVGDIMERNHRETSHTFQVLYEDEVAKHKVTKEQLRLAEERLERIGERMAWLFYGDDLDDDLPPR